MVGVVRLERGPVEAVVGVTPWEAPPLPSAAFGLGAKGGDTRTVGEADLEALAAWLPDRLRERWPHLDEDRLGAFLRGCVGSALHRFILSAEGDAVGLAEVVTTPLQPAPTVREVFLRQRVLRKPPEAALAVYADLLTWARSIGAAAFHYAVDTDLITDFHYDAAKAAGPSGAKKRSYYVVGF